MLKLTCDTDGLAGHVLADPGVQRNAWRFDVRHIATLAPSLFPGGVGKTGSPDDFANLLDDVSTKVFDRLPDETWFYPGHGDDSTLGAERPHLAEWRERGW